MDRELKHPNHSDALQSSNNPVNQRECIDTSVSQVNNLDEPFYCTINELVRACPKINYRTLRRYIKQGEIEARRVSCTRVPQGCKYEVAVYRSSVREKIIRLRQEKLQNKNQRFEKKRINRTVKKVVKDISSNLYARLVTATDTNSEKCVGIKEHIILLLEEKSEELL
jgi:hypothetical protein